MPIENNFSQLGLTVIYPNTNSFLFLHMPGIQTKIDVDKKLLTSSDEERRVIVHCDILTIEQTYIRIWPSTFLMDVHSNYMSKLIHAENIIAYPFWQYVPGGVKHRFTLIFEALPSGCTTFNLLEKIPDLSGFSCSNIPRNKEDIYRISF